MCLALCLALPAAPAAAHPHRLAADAVEAASFAEVGRASYYGEKHDGKRTANGMVYDRTVFTAAHRTLPFGTVVRVTNLSNHRMVKVRITDRGPHVKGRVIDVSSVAARELGMQRRGIARVRVRVFRSDQAAG